MSTVLVVDDDPEILRLLDDYLSSRGFSVLTAENGSSALEKFEREAVDIVVTDLAMTGLSGLQVARRCRASKPAVPVVMLTAYGLLIGDDECAENGIAEVVPEAGAHDAHTRLAVLNSIAALAIALGIWLDILMRFGIAMIAIVRSVIDYVISSGFLYPQATVSDPPFPSAPA